MKVEDFFEEAMQHIAGTCMMDPEQSLNEILDFRESGRHANQKEIDAFELFLEENECYECEQCGWYGYPGEETQGLCSDCQEDQPED